MAKADGARGRGTQGKRHWVRGYWPGRRGRFTLTCRERLLRHCCRLESPCPLIRNHCFVPTLSAPYVEAFALPDHIAALQPPPAT
jgi:hypothetical protein